MEQQDRNTKKKFVQNQERLKALKTKNDLNKWQRFKDKKL